MARSNGPGVTADVMFDQIPWRVKSVTSWRRWRRLDSQVVQWDVASEAD